MEGQAAFHHCLFDGFLEACCSVALFHERHDKLFCQFFGEQPPRVYHFPHVTRSQCFLIMVNA